MIGLLSVVVTASMVDAADPHPRDIDPEAAHAPVAYPAGGEPTRAPPAPTTSRPVRKTGPSDPSPGPLPPTGTCWHTQSQCRSLSITGVVTGALGLAGVGTGIGLLLRPDEPMADMPAFQHSTKPPGVVILGMGIGVVVTGALMILAGQRAWKLGADPGRRLPRGPAS